MSDKAWKILKVLLVLGTILAALKLNFVDYTLDEEYQIVMAYRNISGDSLFKQMWEPHQTSAFFCAGLMWIYTTVLGTSTGVILFLRFVALAIQIGLAYAVYKTLQGVVEKEYSFLLALLFFNIVPKNIQIPDFSNMQLWFLVIVVLSLIKYYKDKEKNKNSRYLLVIMGIALSCEILTYPTCIILFPFLLIYILCKSGKERIRDCVILTLTCAICGGTWMLCILSRVSLDEFLMNLDKLLSFDLTHDVSGVTNGKVLNYVENVKLWGFWLAVILIVSGILFVVFKAVLKHKGKNLEGKDCSLVYWLTAVLLSEGVQIYYWVIRSIGYEYLQIHLLVIWLAALALWRHAGEGKKKLVPGILATLLAYAGVMYISDLAMYYTLPHGTLGIVFALAVFVLAAKNSTINSKKCIMILLVSLCFCAICGKGYTLRRGQEKNDIFEVRNIMKKGPAAGIFADYMCAHIYNRNYENYREYLQPGDKVLIVANMIMSVSTTSYMFDDYEVCHFSIVDPTTYDERLLVYWEQYPEKKPDVIVVDCWYGEVKEPADSWIMQYIEKDFGYTSVMDGDYVRFYRR